MKTKQKKKKNKTRVRRFQVNIQFDLSFLGLRNQSVFCPLHLVPYTHQTTQGPARTVLQRLANTLVDTWEEWVLDSGKDEFVTFPTNLKTRVRETTKNRRKNVSRTNSRTGR